MIYREQGKFLKAVENFSKCLEIREESKNINGMAYAFSSLGATYQDLGKLDDAQNALQKSLDLRIQLKDKKGISNSNRQLANLFLKKNHLVKAKQYVLESVKYAKEIGFTETIRASSDLAYRILKKKNDFKLSFEMYELYIQMRDSVNSEQNKKASIKTQLKYEYEKQAAADSVKNAEEQKVKDAQLNAQSASLKQEKTQRYALYGGLILVIGFLGFVFNRFRVTQKQKKIIEEQKHLVDEAFEKLHEKNKEVMDSIYYARRIQRALITSERYIARNLRDLRKT